MNGKALMLIRTTIVSASVAAVAQPSGCPPRPPSGQRQHMQLSQPP